MKYTEEEAKALLKVMGFEVMSVPEWNIQPNRFVRYIAQRRSPTRVRAAADTYNELLDDAIKSMEASHEQ